MIPKTLKGNWTARAARSQNSLDAKAFFSKEAAAIAQQDGQAAVALEKAAAVVQQNEPAAVAVDEEKAAVIAPQDD